MSGLRLGRIPREEYSAYRYEAIFGAYKWDPQVEDQNTVAEHVVLMNTATARQLEAWAEQLAAETVQMEMALCERQGLAKQLGIPRKIRGALKNMEGYRPEGHVRLMRFDFHPTTTGWAVSEVNSDVPGGLAEASVLPQIARRYFPQYGPRRNTAQQLLKAFGKRVEPGKRIAFVHATSYADDRQVMQFLGDYFEQNGYAALYAAPNHFAWENHRPTCLIEGAQGPVGGIVRFFPLEWLANLPRRASWQGYYNTETPSCNHPAAIFTQSKRLPLVWDRLGVELPAWKALLPTTKAPTGKPLEPGWIYKPALGRVGEDISIQEAISAKNLAAIYKAARRSPQNWVVQKRFDSQPVTGPKGESYHLCVG
ncbi:MAG: glutathionylspermidine synthase family protein, partial [Oscillospiraceae bacterium]